MNHASRKHRLWIQWSQTSVITNNPISSCVCQFHYYVYSNALSWRKVQKIAKVCDRNPGHPHYPLTVTTRIKEVSCDQQSNAMRNKSKSLLSNLMRETYFENFFLTLQTHTSQAGLRTNSFMPPFQKFYFDDQFFFFLLLKDLLICKHKLSKPVTSYEQQQPTVT